MGLDKWLHCGKILKRKEWIMILEIDNINMPVNYTDAELERKIRQKLKINEKKNFKIHKLRESIDARKKSNVHYTLNIGVEIEGYKNFLHFKEIQVDYTGLHYEKKKISQPPIVVGFGPSGIFCALALSEMGLNPIVIEQGKDVDERAKDVQNFWNDRKLNIYSNVQNGEGGAGAFSDGKLTTNINSPYNKKVLNEFILAGAPKEIYYKSKPHIGSDNLPNVIKNIRQKIIKNGGKVLFNRKFLDILTKNNEIIGIRVLNLENHCVEELNTQHLILAVGHSAIDTFEILYKNKIDMSPKPFAMGVRIEQNQKLINQSQYGNFAKYLGSADYKLVTHLENGRSVFTFCMCPGGEVIASSSEEGTIVTNGMSNFKRDLDNANSAVLVNVSPKDFIKGSVLDGLYFQRFYEKLAYQLGGNNYNAPCQKVKDFLGKSTKIIKKTLKKRVFDIKITKNVIFLQKNSKFLIKTTELIKATYKPNVTYCDISKCLPDFVTSALREALPILNSKVAHFADDDCLLTAIESRTSCPIQITRDESGQSNIKGLYPIGEGAGYAGGIMTSALDGIYCAEKIYNALPF